MCAVDPLLVLEPERLQAAVAAAQTPGTPAAFVSVQVPFRLLAQLNQGSMELAEHDDPGNTWWAGPGVLPLAGRRTSTVARVGCRPSCSQLSIRRTWGGACRLCCAL